MELTAIENVLGDEFWAWFQSSNQPYLFINEVDLAERTRLLDEMMERLHRYCDKLFFQVGGHPRELIQELIITAEGNKDYFEQAERLVGMAPEIANWKLIALIPPMPVHFEVNFEGGTLNTRDLWFAALDNVDNPKLLGIQVFVKGYSTIQNKDRLMSGLFKILDLLLGEKSFAIDIDYVDAAELPDNLEEEYLMKLDELAQFIDWHKKQIAPNKRF